jgi:hypothetical protein
MKPLGVLFTVAALLAASSCSEDTTAPPRDETPPSAPTGLTATQIARAHVRLTWEASTDNVEVTRYAVGVFDVNRDRYLWTYEATEPEYVDTLAIPWEPTRYSVVAYDAAGNPSSSAELEFIVHPTAADVAGTWTLSVCDRTSPFPRYNECADEITFTIGPDSAITGTIENLLLIAPKGGNVYETAVIPGVSLSGRFSGQMVHVVVESASGADWHLTSGALDLAIAPRAAGGWEWRLREVDGSYAISGEKYSYVDFQWFGAFNNGTISLRR